jgi:hypothetical protein
LSSTPSDTPTSGTTPNLGDFHVVVRFGRGIPTDAQAQAMMAFERRLRELTAAPVEVFKDPMADDSKLRRSMTPEQRAKLP